MVSCSSNSEISEDEHKPSEQTLSVILEPEEGFCFDLLEREDTMEEFRRQMKASLSMSTAPMSTMDYDESEHEYLEEQSCHELPSFGSFEGHINAKQEIEKTRDDSINYKPEDKKSPGSIVAKWLSRRKSLLALDIEETDRPTSLKEIALGDFNTLFREYSTRCKSEKDHKQVEREIGKVAGRWFSQQKRRRQTTKKANVSGNAACSKDKVSMNDLFREYRIKERCCGAVENL